MLLFKSGYGLGSHDRFERTIQRLDEFEERLPDFCRIIRSMEVKITPGNFFLDAGHRLIVYILLYVLLKRYDLFTNGIERFVKPDETQYKAGGNAIVTHGRNLSLGIKSSVACFIEKTMVGPVRPREIFHIDNGL